MIELQDAEAVAALRIVQSLTAKYGHRTWSGMTSFSRLAEELAKDATERLRAIGLVANVDTAPMLAGLPPQIVIQDRLKPFDPEMKRWEVRKAHEQGQTLLNEDKI